MSIIAWLAALITLTSIWVIGSDRARTRLYGFAVNALGAGLWGLYALGTMEDPWALFLVNLGIIAFDARGMWRNGLLDLASMDRGSWPPRPPGTECPCCGGPHGPDPEGCPEGCVLCGGDHK
jgi:hypothetical protein